MDDRSRVLATSMLGAIAGGVWGWLYLTANGRRIRTQIEPKLDDFRRELATAVTTVEKARAAASEGWQSFNDLAGASRGVTGNFTNRGATHGV